MQCRHCGSRRFDVYRSFPPVMVDLLAGSIVPCPDPPEAIAVFCGSCHEQLDDRDADQVIEAARKLGMAG